jgi:alpha-tubulin suppressor-like RCC1 family protein
VKIPGLASVVEVAPSALQFRCARESDGSVWCWGANNEGQLGNSNMGLTPCPGGSVCNVVPARVPLGALGAVQLRAAWQSICARVSNGDVYCWGEDITGVSGPAFPPQFYQPTPTSIGIHDVTDLALGGGDDINETHACAVIGGTVWCWGSNTRGQLGHAPNTLGDITSSDGGPSCYLGGPCNPTPTQVTDGTGSALTNVTLLAGGGRAMCALRGDGTVWCWGSNFEGQLGANVPSDDQPHPVPVQVFTLGTTAVAVESGWPWAIAMDDAGHAWTWGDNGEGQLADGTLTGATCASGKPCQLAPEMIPALGGASLLSAHGNGMALVGGQILVWGFNDQAQLGHLPAVDAGDTLVCPRGLPCNPSPQVLPGLP